MPSSNRTKANGPRAGGSGGGGNTVSPVVRSAIWAAWADALGFPLELRGGRGRKSTRPVTEPIRWKRRVGGRFGPEIDLPAGTYSDDTQLRLAVCRCLRGRWGFDVEAFSTIELPVFLAYELGAGRGTRAAVHWLERPGVRWSSNFYEGQSGRYVDGGGNGAAMRIQPHVWATPDFQADSYLRDVLRNAVITHGHPRAIVGAAFHSLSLGTVLRTGQIPASHVWDDMARYLERIPTLMASDETLAERWLPLWERAQRCAWSTAVMETVKELRGLLNRASRAVPDRNGRQIDETYASVARELGGLDPKTRGAGTVSAVLALWVARSGARDPAGALAVAANLGGSDTDTVATMAGALLGAVTETDPPGELLDRELHAREAERADRLRNREPVDDFPHPDPLHWRPPPTLSDVVGMTDGKLAVAGLGPGDALDEPKIGKGRETVGWQWLRLSFGQTVVIKRRLHVDTLPEHARARPRARPAPVEGPQALLFEESAPQTQGPLPDDVEEGVALLVAHDFERVLMGRLLAHYARRPDGSLKASSFGSLVAEALRDGLDRPGAGAMGSRSGRRAS